MATANIGKKVSFEIVSPYSDDFMGSVNTLRNEARKNNKQVCHFQKLTKLLRQLERRKIRVVTPRELLKLIEK